MADQKLCIKNQFGYCKYNRQCLLKHVDIVCENPECQISKCNLRHPKECLWFQDYQRCKFQICAYRHDRNINFRKDVKILNYKSKKLEHLIQIKEAEEDEQVQRVNDLHKSERDKSLEI